MDEQACLILDIGSGTQDALLYESGREVENCAKFVLPSPARMVARRIEGVTQARRDIYLCGQNMGGGFWRSLKAHQEAGFGVYAHPEAALALGDDLEQLQSFGILVTTSPPLRAVAVRLGDYEHGFWQGFLQHAGLPLPDLILACAQDHGFHPGKSNRLSRFVFWQSFLEEGGNIAHLLYESPPLEMTRLSCLRQAIGHGLVADTGAAAMLGALFDEELLRVAHQKGLLIVNIGNSHTLAFLVYGERVFGIYEHHTGCLDSQKLWSHLLRFQEKNLSHEEVFADGGHGCAVSPKSPVGADFEQVVVLGPRRALLADFPVTFPAPGGDMMLAGCFGLLKAWRER